MKTFQDYIDVDPMKDCVIVIHDDSRGPVVYIPEVVKDKVRDTGVMSRQLEAVLALTTISQMDPTDQIYVEFQNIVDKLRKDNLLSNILETKH